MLRLDSTLQMRSHHQHHEKDAHFDRKDSTKKVEVPKDIPPFNIPTWKVKSDGSLFIKFVKPVVA